MVSTIFGVDAIRNSAGELIQIGQIGFGHQSDWEIIERRTVSASQDEEFFWDADTYDEIEISLQRLKLETNDDINMEFTLSTDGSTFHTGGTDYTVVRYSSNDDPIDAVQDQGGASFDFFGFGDQANETVSGIIHIFDVAVAGEVKPIIMDSCGILANGSTTRDHFGVVMTVNSDAILGINVGMVSTNTFSGNIVVRGRRIVPTNFTSQDDWVVLSEKIADDDATIDFEPADFDITLYDEFEIQVIDMVPDTNFENFEMLISDDGGATYEATLYAWANHRFASNNTALVTNSGSDTLVQIARSLDNGAGESANFTITVKALDSAFYKQFSWVGTTFSTNAIFKWDGMFSWKGATNAINGIRFLMETNNIASGKFRLRGRLKAPLGRPVQRWMEATVQTADATPVNIATVSLPVDKAKVVRGFGTVTEPSTANQFSFNFIAHGKNDGGTSAEGSGAPVIDKLDSDGGNSWDFDVDVDDTTDTIRMIVTGEAATVLDWRIQYEVITEDNL